MVKNTHVHVLTVIDALSSLSTISVEEPDAGHNVSEFF